jgi:hypothetical protein
MNEKLSPNLKNLGKDCLFWQNGCQYPKIQMQGRTSCEGIVDDVCLYLLTGRHPKSLTETQIKQLKLSPPSLGNKAYIPPGDIIE